MSQSSPKGSEDISLLWTFLARGVAERVVRPALRPGLEDFYHLAQVQSTDGREILRAATGAPAESVNAIYEQGRTVFESIPDLAVEGSAYRKDWRMELEHASLLYGMVRLARPRTAFETGIADGFSSRVILTALTANQVGRLVSVDVRTGTGGLVPDELRSAWRPVIVNPAQSLREIDQLLESERPIDLFLHDSRHTYDHMLGEYRAAWPRLSPGGWLLSDDADSTFAFLDFAKQTRAPVYAHVGGRKVLGLIHKPGPAAPG